MFRSPDELASKIEELGLGSRPPTAASPKSCAPVTVDKSRRSRARADPVEHRGLGGAATPGGVRSGMPVIVGRQATSDLCIEDDSVSQKHAMLVCLGDIWWAFDLKSTSGTLVNQRR